MVYREHTHFLLTLLGLLALLLLAVSGASAGSGGWQEGEGVRYRTYRTPEPAYYPVTTAVTGAVVPWISVAPWWAAHDVILWLDPGALTAAPWGFPPAAAPDAPADDSGRTP